MYINDSVVALADTLIEKNNAIVTTAISIYGSKVTMDHCDISENYAKSVFFIGKHRDANIAGIFIDPRSEVTMNDVPFEGNIADGDVGAIENTGTLNLNEGTVITRNTAKRYSALYSPESGIVIKGNGIRMYDNHDDNPNDSICIEGILKSVEF